MSFPPRYRWSDFPKMAGLALLYVLLIKVVFGYLTTPNHISIVWLPSGLGIAALLIGGMKYWPGIFIGALAGYVLMLDRSMTVSIFVALGCNTFEAVTVTWLLRTGQLRWKFNAALNESRDYLILFTATSFAAFLAAFTGAVLMLQAGFITSQEFLVSAMHWWMGDVLGAVLLTPLILIWAKKPQNWLNPRYLAESAVCFGLTALCGLPAFLNSSGNNEGGYEHSVILFIIWSAVRLGRHGVTIVIAIIATQALLGLVVGTGPFISNDNQRLLLSYWIYIVMHATAGALLALYVDKAQKINVGLQITLNRLSLKTQSFQSALDSINQGFAIWGSDDRLVHWNSQCLDYWYNPPKIHAGLSRKELLLHIAKHDGLGPGNPVSLAEERRIQIISGENEDEFTMHDGRVILVTRYAMPDGGQASVYTDVTERKKEILHLVARQTAILDGANYSIIATDTNGLITDFNGAAERLLGYSADEMIGKQTLECFHDATEVVAHAVRLTYELGRTIRPGFDVFVEKAKSGIAEEREWSYICKDGTRVPVMLSVTAMFDKNSHIVGFIGIANDISARKRLEIELIELLSFNQTIVAKSDTGIMVHRETGECVLCNETAAKIVGATYMELQQHNFRLSRSWQESGQLAAAEAALRTGITQHFMGQMTTIYGKEIWSSCTLTKIIREGAPHLLSVFSDITPHKAAEENMRQAKEIAEAALARAMQAEQGVINVSEQTLQRIGQELHDDLGQQLTGLAFLAETLHQDLKGLHLSAESEHASKMTRIINDTVSHVRQLAHGLYPIEMEDAGLPSMLKHLTSNIETANHIKCQFKSTGQWEKNGPEITINLFRITQEAISNAIKHGKATEISIALIETSHEKILDITDNGIGFEGAGNSGLGMHTMQYRASIIGGTLHVMPANNNDAGLPIGTRVVVRFPIQ